jgi:uncharacterized protein (DUF1330 family)
MTNYLDPEYRDLLHALIDDEPGAREALADFHFRRLLEGAGPVTGRGVDDMVALLRELSARGAGGINPNESQLVSLIHSGDQGPVHLVNLLAFRERAIYPSGHELAGAGLTGAQAFARYEATALEVIGRCAGKLILCNDVYQVLIGQSLPWDQILVVEFPETGAFVDMIRDRDYQASLVHRDAGLAEVLILVSRSLLPI